MARILKTKELVNTRLATTYGGWVYCDACGENIGYLCYSTYDNIELEYTCLCGSKGKMMLNFEDSTPGQKCSEELVLSKKRLCCSKDNEPLITILEKKLSNYQMNVTCKSCHNIYSKIK